ncbi:hypothetical protein ACIBQX_38970 [Nonomuraea sp. NPDC049714]|uniref:hypothetical protein n=1 Tax=Nonomuraea sp. NPDC049714 TaxID=3364357 RepID=UPI00379C542E
MRSKLATLFLATMAAGSCIFAAAGPASASDTQVGKRKWISSESGWQRSGVFVEPGDLVRVAHVGGRWTVDHRSFPYVSSRGYPWHIDREIFQGCKILNRHTYGTLIGRINGHVFKVGGATTFRVREEGFLQLRINDGDGCLGDNDGAVRVKVSIIDEG